MGKLHEVGSRGHLLELNNLIKSSADTLDDKNLEGRTALMLAAGYGKADCVNALLEAGADVRCLDNHGQTALMYLFGSNVSDDVIVTIFQKLNLYMNTSDLNIINPQLCSVLMLAAQDGHIKSVNKLLAAGADVSLANSKGNTALMYAAEGNDKIECVAALLAAGANVFDLDDMPKVMSIGPQLTRVIVEHKAKLATLLNVVTIGQPEGLNDALSALNDKINVPLDKNGKTALMYAAAGGHTQCVEQLLKRNADMSQANKIGQTSLMLAAGYGKADCVNALLEAGADVRCLDNHGQTALTFAAGNSHDKSFKLLLGGDKEVVRISAEPQNVKKILADEIILAIKQDDVHVFKYIYNYARLEVDFDVEKHLFGSGDSEGNTVQGLISKLTEGNIHRLITPPGATRNQDALVFSGAQETPPDTGIELKTFRPVISPTSP